MARRSACGLLITCALAAAQPAAAQDTGPPTDRTRYDLTLKQALGLARARAPDVRAAQARIAVARGRLVGAALPLRANPTVDVGGGPRIGPGGVGPDIDVGVGQVFELGGQRGARIDIARAGIDRAGWVAKETARRSAAAVAASFLLARHAEQRLRIATDAKRLAAEVRGVARSRQQAGDGGALEAQLSALALARAEADRRSAESKRARHIGELRALLGIEPDAQLRLRGDLLTRRRYALTKLLTRARARPDLRALDAAVGAAVAEARLGEAQAWPELGVRLGYTREEEADVVMASLSLSLPLFDRGQGMTATANARAEALRIQREATASTTEARIRAALRVHGQLLEAVERFEQSGLTHIESSSALAQRAYAAGAMRLGELLAVRRELVAARTTYVDLALRAALAGAAIEALAGGAP